MCPVRSVTYVSRRSQLLTNFVVWFSLSESYVVPTASHAAVASYARVGRLPLARQRVPSWWDSYSSDFTSHSRLAFHPVVLGCGYDGIPVAGPARLRRPTVTLELRISPIVERETKRVSYADIGITRMIPTSELCRSGHADPIRF
jgi:hypothetical protein